MIAPARRDEEGMVLVNMLLIVALAAAVLTLMLTAQDASFQRTIRLREAAQAMAVVQGGELSAIAALRRDGARAMDGDNRAEAWANIGDANATIEGGHFDLAIADAQDRFNINSLTRGDAISIATFARILVALRIDQDTGLRIGALLALTGPIADIAQLRDAGVADGDLVRLATLVTALPQPSGVNINDAPEPLLAVLFQNAAKAAQLASSRARTGRLTSEDLSAVGTMLPPGTELTSDYFWVRTRATIGATAQQSVALLRRRVAMGRPEVSVVARWRGAAAPLQAPPLPIAHR